MLHGASGSTFSVSHWFRVSRGNAIRCTSTVRHDHWIRWRKHSSHHRSILWIFAFSEGRHITCNREVSSRQRDSSALQSLMRLDGVSRYRIEFIRLRGSSVSSTYDKLSKVSHILDHGQVRLNAIPRSSFCLSASNVPIRSVPSSLNNDASNGASFSSLYDCVDAFRANTQLDPDSSTRVGTLTERRQQPD